MAAGQAELEVACQQVLLEDASVFSIQWCDLPARFAARITSDGVLERYLAHIRGCTAGIIRPCHTPDGIEFRLLGTGLSLLSFLHPIREGNSLALGIAGGLLVQARGRGRGELRLGLEAQPAGIRVSLHLSGYCPLILGGPSPSFIRRRLYSLTQADVHRLVTVRFLARLYRDISGTRPRVRVVGCRVREGRPV